MSPKIKHGLSPANRNVRLLAICWRSGRQFKKPEISYAKKNVASELPLTFKLIKLIGKQVECKII